ncbi:GumC family protein [Trichlorobacter ammonificans]|uniref:Lipopolysaccharide biosynthesis protein n=1 Tax=Trichlorobacter ammonificans TaxID=2916410 RepID=A0ABN8HHT9_9BACT|nr:Wzz/FepE/Etk N-terminal domain-containing protein [Trichlorobacter ammonificans]CAH2032328.1 Lipopolysaccharide biosynthesis protein [Trichlorobacter ammonificans]
MEELRQNIHPSDEQDINLLELLRVLVRRRGLIIKLTSGTAVLAVLYALTLTNIYTATAKLLPPQKDGGSGAAAALLGQLGGLGGMAAGLGGSSELYMGILKSRSVADAVIQRMELEKELKTNNRDVLRSALQGMVKFQAGKDGIITVTADNKDPRKAAMLANTFVDELQRKSLQLNLTKASTERSFLEKRLVVVKQDLKNAEDDMKAFQEQYKTIKADAQAAASIEGVARVKAELVTSEVQLAALRHSMTDEAPEVRRMLATIARLRAQLNAMSGAGDAGGVIPSVGSAPGIGVEYVRKLREFKLQEALFEQLTKQFELAKLNEARDSSSLQVLDEAVVPTQKSKPRRSMIVILATVTALFCSVLLVFIQEYFSKLPEDDAAIIREMKQSLADSFQPLLRKLPFSRQG